MKRRLLGFGILLAAALLFCACAGKEKREVFRLDATVIEVSGESGILVEPAEDAWERSSADRIRVSMPDGTGADRFSPGDRVRIEYDGMLAETYPAQIARTYSVEKTGTE